MSEYARVKILTTESVDKLRLLAVGRGAQTVWNTPLDALVEDLGLKLVESEYEVDLEQGLLGPAEGVANRELDAENAQRILATLPAITPADATDERLWVTLALGAYRDYTVTRWPIEREDLGNHVLNHVFASTARGRERDHAIARLWWSGYYVHRFAPGAEADALRTFFLNSQLSVDLLGRPNLATVGPFARSALRIFTKYYLDREVPFARGPYQDFFKGIDLLAGRRAIGSMPDDEVETVLEASFRAHLGLEGSAP